MRSGLVYNRLRTNTDAGTAVNPVLVLLRSSEANRFFHALEETSQGPNISSCSAEATKPSNFLANFLIFRAETSTPPISILS